MIRTPFIVKDQLAQLIVTAQVNKTSISQKSFTATQTMWIFKYLRRTQAWLRVDKTTYRNTNSTLEISFLNNHSIRLSYKNLTSSDEQGRY